LGGKVEILAPSKVSSELLNCGSRVLSFILLEKGDVDAFITGEVDAMVLSSDDVEFISSDW